MGYPERNFLICVQILARMKNLIAGALTFFLLFGCGTAHKATREAAQSIGQLKMLGNFVVPHKEPFRGTTIGGLSGIDYDSANDLYYLISDDRSAINPARFYTAKINLGSKGFDTVIFTGVHSLVQPNGNTYPNSKENPQMTPDPEGIRYNPHSKQLAWTSEGERIVRDKDTVLTNPAITLMTTDGKFLDSFPLPPNLYMHSAEKGPRQNGVLEGLSFADNFTKLFVNVEEPLYEDGPRADLTHNQPWIRIFQFDVKTKKNSAQYAYLLEPVAHPANPASGFKINGVPEILALGNGKLLVMERSFSTGRLPCTIRIFLADLNGAENIAGIGSLKQNPPAKPVKKKLLLNMDDLGMYVDNVEGMTFGPTLPNGHRTLIMVADDNFSLLEQTQFFLFEILPVNGE